MKSERIGPARVASIINLSVRRVQQLSACGKIPSAAMMIGAWSYDERIIRQWVKRQTERAAQVSEAPRYSRPTPTGADPSYGHASRLLDVNIDAAFERLIWPKRKPGLRGGKKR